MDLFLAVIYLLTCGVLVWKLFYGTDLIDLHLGVIGVFSLGYFPLPVLFKDLSSLKYIDAQLVAEALLIHGLFLVCLLIGAGLARRVVPARLGLTLGPLDRLATRHKLVITLAAFAIYVAYARTQELTSYSAQDFELYFQDRGPFVAIIAAVGGLALAFIASSVAGAWRERRWTTFTVVGLLFVACVASTLSLGQRLAILTPLVMLLAALFADGQRKRAINVLGITVAVLILVSPFAVYLRETRLDRADSQDSGSVLSEFSSGSGAINTAFKSILDRSDLVYVTAMMKGTIDAAPTPGPVYYWSVLAIPIPKLVLPDKPFLLSDDGTSAGEMSIWAWKTLVGGTGSLTAFGGLVAYREAGWLGVLCNGVATGVLFVLLARWLGGGGFVARWFYAGLFVNIAVKKVPPSFFEALAEALGFLPFILLAIVVCKALKLLDAIGHPRGPRPVRLRASRLAE